jgi:hypothetical protein
MTVNLLSVFVYRLFLYITVVPDAPVVMFFEERECSLL